MAGVPFAPRQKSLWRAETNAVLANNLDNEEHDMPLNEEGFISRVSLRHSVSIDAVRTILRALRSGGGGMAQFSHPDFGGMSQWSPGMIMVGRHVQ